MCAKSASIAIYTVKIITHKLFLTVKAFDPGLKLLEVIQALGNGNLAPRAFSSAKRPWKRGWGYWCHVTVATVFRKKHLQFIIYYHVYYFVIYKPAFSK